MNDIDLQSVFDDLESDRLEVYGVAVERAAQIVRALTTKAVDTLRRGPHRFPIAERLSRFGSLAIPDLKKLFQESHESDIKILAALVLLDLGSKDEIPYLLDAVFTSEKS